MTAKRAWLDMEYAPKDGSIITVYDPKPSVEYGPDIHKAFYDKSKDMFVATENISVDPYDIEPESWLCEDVDKFFGIES